MLKFKIYSVAFLAIGLGLSVTSCSEEDEAVDTTISTQNELSSTLSSERSSTTPWDFDSSYSTNDDFQVDNDGNGAHNWDEDDYSDDPNDNGFDIRDYIFVNNNRLVLICPNGNGRRRAEYRDQTNIDLDRRNRCLLYTSPSPRDGLLSRMPSSA